MGNHPSKSGQPAAPGHAGTSASASSNSHHHQHQQQQHQQQQAQASAASRNRNRQSRADFAFLSGLTPRPVATAGDASQPEPRRETKAEREARRLERERVAREKERERSMKEEHVDGGFLVTMGIYRGVEDFNKAIVRQLQIERRLAPFWRPIQIDMSDLSDAQLVAVARGEPVPEANAPLPADLLRPQSPASPSQSTQSLNLTVPGAAPANTTSSITAAQPVPSAATGPGSSTNNVPAALTLSSLSTSPPAPPRQSRAKAIAGVFSQGLRSRNSSQTELAPRELSLPHDPFVDGKPVEVVLYRNADDCPICFSTYPPYLNYTRCCGNPICSECFVQIKRPDPHVPEHHGEASTSGSGANAGTAGEVAVAVAAVATADQGARETHNMLVSEPAACPYCMQPEFGVAYEAPPFRRGLVSAGNSVSHLLSSTAMSSQTSLQSATPPASPATPGGGTRRRTQSLSVNAPGVITTDRIRPDWASKLASQRSTQARRAAAATALHQAAFIMYSGDRQFPFGRPGRFMRRGTGSSLLANDAAQAGSGGNGGSAQDGPEPGPRTSSGTGQAMTENDRLQQFEEVMLAEAIRLSIAAEEERSRKAEKEAKKEAKKKEKEDRKAANQQSSSSPVYGDSQAASSRSSLSLGFGRRRGNSGASLRAEATVQGAMAATSGANNDVGSTLSATGTGASGQVGQAASPPSSILAEPSSDNGGSKGKGVDRSGRTSPSAASQPIAMSSRGPSHLRQASNISSLSSSPMDSPLGSYSDHRVHSATVGGGGGGDAQASAESMFNFRSMASNLGIDLDRRQEREGDNTAAAPAGAGSSQGTDPDATQIESSVATLRPENSATGMGVGTGATTPPEVRVVPAPTAENDAKTQSAVKEVGADAVVGQEEMRPMAT